MKTIIIIWHQVNQYNTLLSLLHSLEHCSNHIPFMTHRLTSLINKAGRQFWNMKQWLIVQSRPLVSCCKTLQLNLPPDARNPDKHLNNNRGESFLFAKVFHLMLLPKAEYRNKWKLKKAPNVIVAFGMGMQGHFFLKVFIYSFLQQLPLLNMNWTFQYYVWNHLAPSPPTCSVSLVHPGLPVSVLCTNCVQNAASKYKV